MLPKFFAVISAVPPTLMVVLIGIITVGITELIRPGSWPFTSVIAVLFFGFSLLSHKLQQTPAEKCMANAVRLSKEGKHVESLAEFDKAVELNPDDLMIRWGRSETYCTLGRYSEAIADLDVAINVGSKDQYAVAAVHRSRALALIQLDRNQEALQELTKAIEMSDSKFALAFKDRSELYEKLGDSAAARSDLEKFKKF